MQKSSKKQFKIVFIGSGNVATQLGQALREAGHSILQVYSKHPAAAAALAEKLKCTSVASIKQLTAAADIYIIAVNDDQIAKVARQLKLKNKITVHTSGSIPLEVLKGTADHTGVFYPLQTFTKNKKADFRSIPICLEANNTATLKTLQALAKSISTNVQKISSEERKIIHLAAVFACNFSNHMYSIADEILKENNLSLDILKPLIIETANKIKDIAPDKVQTGPAMRGDKKIMKKHLKLLSENKRLKRLYTLMSDSISDQHE